MFPKSRTFNFPNAFYRFVEMRSDGTVDRNQHVLLCSGWGANKDLAGALGLYLRSDLYKVRSLIILGLAGRTASVTNFFKEHPKLSDRITVLPQLNDSDVIKCYEQAAWVWVHSKKEGYGRSIAEARFCKSAVVATDIAPFREQRDEFTFLYSDLEGFRKAVRECEMNSAAVSIREPIEHDQLVTEISRFCLD